MNGADLLGDRPFFAIAERQRDGKLRILSEHPDARDALTAAKLHAWGGRVPLVLAVTRVCGREVEDAA